MTSLAIISTLVFSEVFISATIITEISETKKKWTNEFQTNYLSVSGFIQLLL